MVAGVGTSSRWNPAARRGVLSMTMAISNEFELPSLEEAIC